MHRKNHIGTMMGALAMGIALFPALALAGPLPVGFESLMVADGFFLPTAFDFTPDGRIFIAEKGGVVHVVDGGVVLPDPLITLTDVNDYGDHGLIGIAVDPNFATNGYIYLGYTYENNAADPTGPKTARIVRYTVAGNAALEGSKTVILGTVGGDAANPSCEDFAPTADCIVSDMPSHTIGGLYFGPDGKLYAAMGDGASFDIVDPLALRVQSIDRLAGKIVRINTDGTGPADNPFYNGDPTANRSKVWNLGLRNPFRFTFRPSNGALFIGDVGWFSWEEVNLGIAGANFGWPCREGAAATPGYGCVPSTTSSDPLYAYPHDGFGAGSITGGIFIDGSNYPAEYQGKYIFGDYAQNWIKLAEFDSATNALIGISDFWDDPDGPVAFATGPDGTIYYLAIYTGELRRFTYTDGNRDPIASASASPISGLLPLAVQFDGTASSDPDNDPLTYAWNFGDGATSTEAAPLHTYTAAGTYIATLTTADGRGGTDADTVTIVAGNEAPNVSITTPANGATYGVGETVALSALATDPEDGPIPGNNVVWTFILHHNTHIHVMAQATGTAPTFIGPDHGGASDVYLEVKVAVTDSAGLTDEASINMYLRIPDSFSVEYFNNTALSGGPGLVANVPAIDFVWPGSPGEGVNSDQFSTRFTGDFTFDYANYRFFATGDDGVRLYIDGVLVVDKWFNQPATEYSHDHVLTAGEHRIRLEHYDSLQTAVARLRWEKLNDLGAGPQPRHVSTTALPNPTTLGSETQIETTVRNEGDAEPFIVDIEVFKDGAKVGQQVFENEVLDTNESRAYVFDWEAPDFGDYRVAVGLIKAGWSGLHEWTNEAATFAVTDGNTKPVITLTGASTITLELGAPFTDPGATAADAEEGDLTADIVVGGNAVNTSVLGTYVITYNVTDSGGLAADQVTRTVRVVTEIEVAGLQFDGVDDYVDTGFWNIEEDNGFTLEAKFRADSTENNPVFLSKAEGPSQAETFWSIGIMTDDPAHPLLSFTLRTETGVRTIVGGAVIPGEMTHVAATYNGAVMNLYRNGVLVASAPKTGLNAIDNDVAVWLGDQPTEPGNHPFHGFVDEMRVWNLPRTQSEIAGAMDETLVGNEIGLIKYWKFDEGFGQDAIDGSNSGHHGTLGSVPTAADSNDPARVGGDYVPGGTFAPAHISTVANPNPVLVGGTTHVSTTITNEGTGPGYLVLNFEIYDESGTQVLQRFFDGQGFAPGETRTFGFDWIPPVEGTYRVAVGLVHLYWSGVYEWVNEAAAIEASTVVISTGPTLTVATAPTTPAAKHVVMGSTDNALFDILLSADNVEDIRVTDITLTDAILDNSPGVASFRDLALYDGATLIGGPVSPAVLGTSTGTATFSLLSGGVIVPKNGTKTLTLRGNVATFSSGGAVSGSVHQFSAATSGFAALGKDSNQAATIGGSAESNAATVYRTKVMLASSLLGASTGRAESATDDLATLNFTANSAFQALLETVTLTFSGSAIPNGSPAFSVDLLDVDTGTALGSATQETCIPGIGDSCSVTFGPEFTIDAGTTKQTRVRVNSLAFDPGMLSVSIEGVGDVSISDGVITAIPLEASIVPFAVAETNYEEDVPPSSNLIVNPSMETAGTLGNPASWLRGGYGTNTRTFTYPVAGRTGASAIRTEITAYTSGDTKWFFADVPVTPGRTYEYSDYSIANATHKYTIRYTHTGGTFSYHGVGVFAPSADWTRRSATFTVPAGVTSMTMFHLIDGVGFLTVDDAALVDTAGGGPAPDTTAPTVSVTAPLSGATVSGTIALAATASDNVGVVGVQFRVDGVAVGAEDTSAPYGASWDTTLVANGSHTVTAVARDAAGNSTISAPVSVTVSNAVPPSSNLIVNPSMETAGTLGNPASWLRGGYGTNTRTFTYPVAGRTGASAIRTEITAYTSGDTKWYFADVPVTPGRTYEYSDYSIANVTHKYTIRYTHAGGTFSYHGVGVFASSADWTRRSVTFTVPAGVVSMTVFHLIEGVGFLMVDDAALVDTAGGGPAPDTTAPTVSVTAPLSGATVSGTIALAATASDNVGVVGVQFRVDGVAVGAEDTSAPYGASWNTTLVGNGTHTVTAIARDAAGNSTTSASITVTVNNVAPPPPPPSSNLIANPSMETAGTPGNPASWLRGGYGTNTRTFTYPVAGRTGASAIRTEITAYTSGDTKWFFADVPVTPGRTYEYSDYSIANATHKYTIRYTHTGGTFSYHGVGAFAPSAGWTRNAATFTVPAGVTSMTMFHLIDGVGFLTVDDAALVEITP